MRAMEYLQLDPLQIIARSQDIKLHSRVLEYTPGMWEVVAYEQRRFFDWGGWLAVRPMDELPHWRVVMHRERDGGPDYDSRIRKLFNLDYVWEVYKPEHQRKFGYYTLPILWGDRLVARFDSKLDRTIHTFVILGLWLEDEVLGQDEAFAEALARGFARFVTFLGADELDAEAIREPLLRQRLCSSKEANSSRA